MRTLFFEQITDDRFDSNIKELLEKRIKKHPSLHASKRKRETRKAQGIQPKGTIRPYGSEKSQHYAFKRQIRLRTGMTIPPIGFD